MDPSLLREKGVVQGNAGSDIRPASDTSDRYIPPGTARSHERGTNSFQQE